MPPRYAVAVRWPLRRWLFAVLVGGLSRRVARALWRGALTTPPGECLVRAALRGARARFAVVPWAS